MQDLEDFARLDIDKLERLADNLKWFNLHHDKLKKNYDGQYVAIQDRQVLDNDVDLERLLNRLDISNFDRSIAVDFVKR